MPEHTRAKAAKERHQLEGALGYALRVENAIHEGKVKTVEELTSLITADTERLNGSLANHCLEDLKLAGWTTGLFEDKEARA